MNDIRIRPIHPEGWAPAKGYANGVLVDAPGRMLFVAGQVAWDMEQRLVGVGDFVTQFRTALANVVTVVQTAGGRPLDVVRLTIYVTDKHLYLSSLGPVGEAYREIMGRHYPAISLVQVAGLVEEGALVEIEATAAIPIQGDQA